MGSFVFFRPQPDACCGTSGPHVQHLATELNWSPLVQRDWPITKPRSVRLPSSPTSMDLSSVLTQQVFNKRDDSGQSPRLLLIVSREVNAQHEEIFSTAVSNVIASSPSGASLLFAVYHPARRYRSLLDSYLRRNNGHRMAMVDVACDLIPTLSHDDLLHEKLRELTNAFSQEAPAAEQHRRTLFIDDAAALLDLGLTPRQLCQLILPKSTHVDDLVIGYHVDGECDDDYLLRLLRRRAFCCVDVSPLETGYTPSIDGQITISRFTCQLLDDGAEDTRPQKFHFRAEGKTIRCYPPGTSNLVR
ncbi:unnamed protein product [Mesocestoides corti]|uniref:Elongator complex protein 6 n=2 Tax=Mesocestoides corti TaxID=53468 RepID=A0A0R3UGS5_MESCO|nr:unnamed protein product [Mesocestoides corti]